MKIERPEQLNGEVIDGRYRLMSFRGRGAFGAVYEAHEESLGRYVRRVGVKLIFVEEQPDSMETVLAEIRSLAQFQHEHVLTYFASGAVPAGKAQGAVFVATELAERTLADELEKARSLDDATLRRVTLGVVKALEYIHGKGAVHCDVNPKNIMRVEGRWKLGDFGLAQPISVDPQETVALEGTPFYLAPEAIEGGRAPARDMYALGVTLLETLTGAYAHEEAPLEEFLQSVRDKPPRIPPDLDPPWNAIIAGCLRRDPAERFSPREVMEMLDDKPPVPAAPSAPSPVAAAAKCIVSSLGEGDFTSIGEALARVAPHGQVVVRPGLYRETIEIDKPVSIVGEGAAQEIVVEGVDRRCLTISAGQASLRGMVLRQRSVREERAAYCIAVTGGRLDVRDCRIESQILACVAVHGAGARAELQRCHILGGEEPGVFVFDGGRVKLLDCDVYRQQKAGLTVGRNGEAEGLQCRFQEGQASGVFVDEQGKVALQDCDIHNHAKMGVSVRSGGAAELTRCRINSNTLFGVWKEDGATVTIDDCDLNGNGLGPTNDLPAVEATAEQA